MNQIFLNLARYHELKTQAGLLYGSVQHRELLERDKEKYGALMKEVESLKTEMASGRLTLLHSEGISKIELKLLSLHDKINPKPKSEWRLTA